MININYAFILVILNFVLLLIVLNKILYKPIQKFLIERQKRISTDMDEAQAGRDKAKKLVQEKEEELKSSAEEVRKMKQLAQRDAEKKADEIVKLARNQEKKIHKDTAILLEQEKKKTMQEIEKELTTMVSDLSAKFLSKKMNDQKDEELIKNIIEKGDDK